MTPQEQQLITELFARLKQTPAQAKDADADQLIRKGVMENPEAPYLLVQTVLIQDMALTKHSTASPSSRINSLRRRQRRAHSRRSQLRASWAVPFLAAVYRPRAPGGVRRSP
jgi:hypothetical protein